MHESEMSNRARRLFLERRLRVSTLSGKVGVDEEIVLRIFGPVQSATEWKCAFSLSISQAVSEMKGEAYGEDGLQAFINAVEAARQLTISRFPNASWLGQTKGDIGFPIIVSPFIPLSRSKSKLLRNKIWKLVNAFLQRHKPKERMERKTSAIGVPHKP